MATNKQPKSVTLGDTTIRISEIVSTRKDFKYPMYLLWVGMKSEEKLFQFDHVSDRDKAYDLIWDCIEAEK